MLASRDTCKCLNAHFIVYKIIIVSAYSLFFKFRALNSMWKSQMRDAFYGTADPSLIDGTVPRDFSGETFEMKGYVLFKRNDYGNRLMIPLFLPCRRSTMSPLYHEPYSNFGALDSSAVGGSSM